MAVDAFVENLTIALAAALAGGLVARLARMPVITGYLLAGMVVGPHTPGVLASTAAVEPVARLGIALLMFAVGVHYSLSELRAMWRTAVLGGAIQIGGTIALGVMLGLMFGWGAYGGLFLGCALALSSTAVAMRMLEERGEQGTSHGKVMLGILVVQDLSLVLMVVLLPALASLSSAPPGADGLGRAAAHIGVAILRAGLFVAATLVLAERGVPALLHRVALTGSRELFLLTGVCICLGAAVAAEALGLGVEVGAFAAGLVVSETDYAHEMSTQVRPLRDVTASLFFVSIGMLLQPALLVQEWARVLAVVAAIIVGKSILGFLAAYLLGWHGRVAILTGFGLAQIGEFSFVLTTLGQSRGLVPQVVTDVTLAGALITLLLSPLLYRSALPLYRRMSLSPLLSTWLNRHGRSEQSEPDTGAPTPDVLVFGCGRIGGQVSMALSDHRVPHVAVDYDVGALATPRRHGDLVRTIYGDASSPNVLASAGIEGARVAVVALPDADVSAIVVRAIRRERAGARIVVRAHRDIDIPHLRDAGADTVIHAELEAATGMIREVLGDLGIGGGEADAYLDEVRRSTGGARAM